MSQTANERSPQGIHTQWVNIDVNGGKMPAYAAWPDNNNGPWPSVIVFMEIFGVNSHIRSVTERLAAEGYVAIAPNYYHRTTQNLELGYSERDVVLGRQHKEQTTREGLLVDIRATIEFLKQHKDVSPQDRMGCIGFCFGGHVAYIAAGMKEIAATASFYGAGIATRSPGGGAPTITHTNEIEGEILCLFGEEDELIPHEETVTITQALKDARVRHEIIRYANTGHGFFCDQRDSYDPSAAEDAWLRVKALFHRALLTEPVAASTS
jgi:carboxymethylenebutenolidase